MIQQKQENNQADTQYEIWKNNTHFMYDLLVVNQLLWPSLTFQWLPDPVYQKHSTIYSYAYGTTTKGNEQGGTQYLHIAEIELPNQKFIQEQQITNIQPNILQSFEHPQEVNKVRYNPLQPNQFATKTVTGKINIYQRGFKEPISILKGHTDEGYALDWKQHGLLSGGYDNKIFVWKNIYQSPIFYQTCKDKVQDTKWIDNQSFISVCDDGNLQIWDLRINKNQGQYKIHNSEANTCDINSFSNHLLVTGGQDKLIRLWDRRKLEKKLYVFESHKDSVIKVEWSAIESNVFISGSLDTKIMIWDILRIGNEIPKDDTSAGPGQLLFTHSGHKGGIADLNCNPYQQLIGSVDEQNGLHFFKMAKNLKQLEYIQDIEYQRNLIME